MEDVKVLAAKLDNLTQNLLEFKQEYRRKSDEDREDRIADRETQDERHAHNLKAITSVSDEWRKTNGRLSNLEAVVHDVVGKVKNLGKGITLTQVAQWISIVVGTVLVLQFLGWHR